MDVTYAFTFRIGLLSGIAFGVRSLADAALGVIVVGESRALLVVLAADGTGSAFSCELGGSRASLLGTGVESFLDGFGLGRELALVVSCKHEER